MRDKPWQVTPMLDDRLIHVCSLFSHDIRTYQNVKEDRLRRAIHSVIFSSDKIKMTAREIFIGDILYSMFYNTFERIQSVLRASETTTSVCDFAISLCPLLLVPWDFYILRARAKYYLRENRGMQTVGNRATVVDGDPNLFLHLISCTCSIKRATTRRRYATLARSARCAHDLNDLFRSELPFMSYSELHAYYLRNVKGES